MFMQTKFDPALWLPRPGETALDYWASFSPMAPFFGISWRFAEPEYPEELDTPETAEPSRIDASAEDAEILREAVPEAAPEAEAEAAPVAEAPAAVAPAVDQLTDIKGVGPKMAEKLAENGITSFAQIAEWSADTVAEMNDRLGCLPGMIERAEWVRQARELANYAQAKRA